MQLIDYLPVIILVIPKILQLVGIIGWLWQGYQIYRDSRIQYRGKFFIRATITWSVGVMLEYFLENYDYWISS